MHDARALFGDAVYPFSFVLGALFGSFLNVIVLRLPEGLSIVRPGSRCPGCARPIAWFDNIPILSYIALRGRCRGCRARISIQYPIVELIVGLLALAVVVRFGATPQAGIGFYFAFALLGLSLVDLRHWYIPDSLSLPLIPLGLLAASLGITVPFVESLIGAAAGSGILLAVSFFYYLARGGSGMGLGDVKLLAGIGAMLGWRALPFVIFAAAAQGLVATGVLALFGKKVVVPDFEAGADAEAEPNAEKRRGFLDAPPVAGKRALPFGPFLSLAAIEQLFLGETLLRDVNRAIFPFL